MTAETAARPATEVLPPLPQRAALLLDFDGTLVELAPRPEQVQVAAELPQLLRDLHARLGGALAIVTGRQIVEIDGFLAPVRLPAAGLHGAELRLDAAQPPQLEAAPAVTALVAELRQYFAEDPRILVEDKRVGVAVHYRLAPERGSECQALMRERVRDPALELLPGSMVIEARPRATDKGRALRALMGRAPFTGRAPVFVGDDLTDEDGIRAAEAAGGYGIKVGSGASAARYRCAGVAEVHAWLRAIRDSRKRGA